MHYENRQALGDADSFLKMVKPAWVFKRAWPGALMPRNLITLFQKQILPNTNTSRPVLPVSKAFFLFVKK
jgi:hypothetical protein